MKIDETLNISAVAETNFYKLLKSEAKVMLGGKTLKHTKKMLESSKHNSRNWLDMFWKLKHYFPNVFNDEPVEDLKDWDDTEPQAKTKQSSNIWDKINLGHLWCFLIL